MTEYHDPNAGRPPVPVYSPLPEDERKRMDTKMKRTIMARKREGKRMYSFHMNEDGGK